MKNHMKTSIVVAFTSILINSSFVLGQARPEIVTESNNSAASLPEIWKNVSIRERLSLIRAAEIDGTRLLLERINGVAIDSESTVNDLSETNDTVKAMIRDTITGVQTVGSPTYHADGRIDIVRKVNVTQLVRKITEVYTRKEGGALNSSSKSSIETKDIVFDVLGSAAIRGSDGHKRILAQRAAQVDAYRRLAERTGSVQITSESTIASLATSDDTIKSSINKIINNAEIVTIRYNSDNSAEVVLKINLNPIVRTIAKRIKGGEVTIISDKTERLIIEEKGMGAPPENLEDETEIHVETIIENAFKQSNSK